MPPRLRTSPSLFLPDTPVDTTTGRVWICVPTYNEAAQVVSLCRSALAALDKAGIDGRVLVVDDSSPDGTGEIAEAYSREEHRVEVLHRPEKQGIGPAYLAGFRHALANGAALVVEMDCDFSHDPAALPHLIAAAGSADIVLGSRYVADGRVVDWPLSRRCISRVGCWYARAVLGVDVRDLTGGFKCFRRGALEHLLGGDVRTTGYAFQIEMTHRALLAGMTVREVPITFRDRREGVSKMSGAIAREAATAVVRMRLTRGRDRSWQCAHDALATAAAQEAGA